MDSTDYELALSGPNIPDLEYLFFRFHKLVPDAKHFVNAEGKSVGNGHDWRGMDGDLRPFMAAHPDVLVQITERSVYEDEASEARHYFQNGKSVTIEPEVTVVWPEFKPSMLR